MAHNQTVSLPTTGVYMASGVSRRFGGNKLLTVYKGNPLFTYGILAALDSGIERLLVVTSHPEIKEFCQSLDNNKVQVIDNNKPELGQSQSVILGVSATPTEHHMLFLAADQPALTAGLIDQLLAAGAQHPDRIIVPTAEGNPSIPTLFPPNFRQQLLAISGDQGGRQVIKDNSQQVFHLPVDPTLVEDIDTPEELQSF